MQKLFKAIDVIIIKDHSLNKHFIVKIKFISNFAKRPTTDIIVFIFKQTNSKYQS